MFGDQCIKFSNFFNGVLFVFGDFLQETDYFNKFTKKSKNKIEDPIKYDSIIPSEYIEKLYKEIDNPSSIDDIIEYHKSDSKQGVITYKKLNKIIIKGTCLNSDYSILNFSDVTAKTYVKNLKFINTLKANNNGIIDISEQINVELPSKDKLMLLYPFESDLKPIIYKPFNDYIQTISNEPYFNLISTYISSINTAVSNLSSLMLNDNVMIRESDYISYRVNDSIIRVLASQAEELNLLPGVSGTWIQDLTLDDSGVTMLPTPIISAMMNLNLIEEEIDPNVLSEEDLNNSINLFINAYSLIENINLTKPKEEYDLYRDSESNFDSEVFLSDIQRYVSSVNEFKNDLSAAFKNSAFKEFLVLRPDIVSVNSIASFASNDEAFEKFCEIYEVNSLFNSLEFALSGIEVNIVQNVIKNNSENMEKDLTFSINKEFPEFLNIMPKRYTSDDFIKSNVSDGSVNALHLTNNINTGESKYLSLNSRYGKQLARFLFESNQWTNIKQKFKDNLSASLPMYNSTLDSTLIFWTKFKESTDMDRIVLLNFTAGNNSEYKFSLRPFSFASLKNSNNNDINDDDLEGNIDSAILTDSIDISDQYSWVMWSIKFDNTSKYKVSAPGQISPFKNKIGLNVTSYTFKSDNGLTGYKIIKHNLNVVPMNETSTNDTILESLSKNDYVCEPFISDPNRDSNSRISINEYENQFNNFTINIGYSKEPTVNSFNNYYYDGYIRNLSFFKGHLTTDEEKAIFKLGIMNDFNLPSEYDNEQLTKLIDNGKFFLGLVSIYDSNNINIINCETKFNGITYKI